MESKDHKCSFEDGITVMPDGVHELDPCIYRDVGIYKNVTVIVSRCTRCGNISISWKPQPNTIVEYEEEDNTPAQ